MQRGNMEPPKVIRRTKKLLNASVCETQKGNIADVSAQVTSRHRSTMSPADFVLPHNLTRTRAADRFSILQSQSDKCFDEEDTEMNLLYDKYLQGLMVEIILRQRTQEKEKLIISQLASMREELDRNKEKLFVLKTRQRDINYLTILQNEIDLQIKDVKSYIKSEDITKVKDVLSQLHSVLRDYDVLRGDNMILPKTPTEWEETIQALKSCRDTLKSIMDLIGSHNESYRCVNDSIKDFLNTYNTIKDHYERLERDINELQALALKTAALSLITERRPHSTVESNRLQIRTYVTTFLLGAFFPSEHDTRLILLFILLKSLFYCKYLCKRTSVRL
ncbi:uncharacterized protein LOC143217033 [Lasioglossum baleicum]|uniref:uncharacterized protein LOC143217033 n=1 Tax=Lasioglossum baleicum TaxID=434251 RepID=UPI003FCD320A